jgi:hypothetical protein
MRTKTILFSLDIYNRNLSFKRKKEEGQNIFGATWRVFVIIMYCMFLVEEALYCPPHQGSLFTILKI